MLTIVTLAQSQDYTTINVTTPGTLKSILDARGELYIFYMKVIGNINVRDIMCLRDNNPALAFLDLSEAIINEYYGNDGTYTGIGGRLVYKLYAANEFPEKAFFISKGGSPLVKVILPNTITSINYAAFYGCSALTDITISNSVTYIGKYTFTGCNGLKSVIIPNSVTTIAGSAFCQQFGIMGLTDLTIGNSVRDIGGAAFNLCKKLKTITCLSTIPPAFGDSTFDYLDALTTVYVPAASVAAYKASKWGTLFFSRIKANPTDDIASLTSSLKVYASRSAVQVEGTAPRETITLYNITGKQLKTVVSTGEKLNIPVDKHGIYLVKIGGKTYKVVV